jgi:hypothetical protein
MKETFPMSPSELLEDIIQRIDPDEVPVEFILFARVTDYRGNEHQLRGAELVRVMRGPERRKLVEARVVLDVRKIRNAVEAGVFALYDEINKLTDFSRNNSVAQDPPTE